MVRLTREGGLDRLEVRDHGPGIPDELRPNLFARFATGTSEGVGLGLWIVRQLAEAHGGGAVAEARDPGVVMVVTPRTADGRLTGNDVRRPAAAVAAVPRAG